MPSGVMSPRPGDRWGPSLHIVEEVKARMELVGEGRSNLLLSMIAAIYIMVCKRGRVEGKAVTKDDCRFDTGFHHVSVYTDTLLQSTKGDFIRAFV